MRMYDIISKKKEALELTKEEINFFIEGYTNGTIPDYQASALLMAIYINKMNDNETLALTKAMVDSGDSIDLSSINGIKVDKHSTGGVGDSVTLILGPMVAACGVPFVKMSGRGLGHTGGTLDKLEAIDGFRVDLTNDEFINNSNKINLTIGSQTGNITPADRKIYALRDVTATVDNLSLIASSIMSKKLAIKSDGIILDVKVGSGAFMKSVEDAENLAREMVKIGKNYGRETKAIISNMDQPLGNAIGNALEVEEAIETLRGEGPKDLYEICLVLGSKLLLVAKRVETEEEARELLKDAVESGRAFEKFIEMVEYQDGNVEVVRDTSLLAKADYILEARSEKSGFVKSIDAEEIGKCSLKLGAGRETMDSELDMAAGLVLNKKVDDQVEEGDVIAYIHTNDLVKGEEVVKDLLGIYEIGSKNKKAQQLIIEEIN